MNTPITTGPRRRLSRWSFGALLLTALTVLVAACGNSTDGAVAEDISATAECDADPVILTTDDGVEFVRTPDSCFDDLPDFPYEPHYVEIDGLRQAYVDEGPAGGDVVLLLHGQPSWSYLYRDMISVLADAGYRVITMDHLGMGRSDKPIDIEDYSYNGHSERLESFIQELGLTDINLFVQDWGSLIGLRVAGENPDLFATIAVGDGALLPVPEGTELFPTVANPNEIVDIPSRFAAMPAQQVPFYDGCELLLPREDNSYFGDWMAYAMTAESFTPSEVVEAMTWFDLTPEEEAAYDAPFPSRTYMAGPRVFPSLVNQLGGNTIDAWNGLTSFEKPFLTLWASNDPGQLGACETQQTLIDNIPGATGQPHDRLPEASHFLQDDQGTEIATRLVDWYGNLDEEPAGAAQGEERVGYELLEIQDDGTIRAWIAYDMTQEQFGALELPSGWLKNQPREGVPDASRFNGSPGADGVLVEEEHFGFEWFHSATITNLQVDLDDTGLLRATTVEKDHEVGFDPGSTLTLLVSPTDEVYVMVSRDAGRTTDDPTVPEGWAIIERTVQDGFTARLSGETTVIRMDNEDSYQGPVTGLDLEGSSATAAGDGPSYGTVNPTLMAELATSDDERPFFMVNLVMFRDQAEYADGRATDLTGEEANDLYGATGVRVLTEAGMRPAFHGEATTDPDSPTIPAWDQVGIARYPSYSEFIAMATDPVFQEGSEHKDAGVEISTVIVTHRVDDPPSAGDLPPADAPVALFEIFSHSGSGVSDRPAALSDYLDGLTRLAADHEGIALGTYEVTGVLIGDGREWDEARVWWFADPSDLDALLADPELLELTAARDLALNDSYRLVLDGVQVEPLGRKP